MMHFCSILILCLIVFGCQSTAKFRAPRNKTIQQSSASQTTNLESFVNNWLSVPYKYGGLTHRGIDCSGFTSLAYKECFGKSIPRISSDQYKQGIRVTLKNLQSGDLVFFSNVRYGNIDHVGIYLGNERFAHATESSGVTISLLSEKYYEKRYAGARRY